MRSFSRRWSQDALLPFEAANAIYKRVNRGQFSISAAVRAMADLLMIKPVLDDRPDIYTRALALAHQFNQRASYDAYHLALAEREGCSYWTADERLWNTVKGVFPWVHWIGEYRQSQL
jgi:predicted nucleic acid-binding protein